MSDDPRYSRGYVSPGDETREMSASPRSAPAGRDADREGYLPLPPELSPRKQDRRRRAQPVGAGGPYTGEDYPDGPEGPIGPDEPGYGRGSGRGYGRPRRRFGWGKRLLTLLVVL